MLLHLLHAGTCGVTCTPTPYSPHCNMSGQPVTNHLYVKVQMTNKTAIRPRHLPKSASKQNKHEAEQTWCVDVGTSLQQNLDWLGHALNDSKMQRSVALMVLQTQQMLLPSEVICIHKRQASRPSTYYQRLTTFYFEVQDSAIAALCFPCVVAALQTRLQYPTLQPCIQQSRCTDTLHSVSLG